MAKKSKQTITYDSRETATILGLSSIFGAIIFILSFFINVDREGNLFFIVRSLFGNSTILTGVFLLNLGLRFLGFRFPFSRTDSLIGQFLLIFLFPALLTSFGGGDRELLRDFSEASKSGGIVGSFIVIQILGETIPTQPATRVIVFIANLIVFPIALAVGVSRVVQAMAFFGRSVLNFFVDFKKSNSEEEGEPLEETEPSTFGDFNKFVKNKDNKTSTSKSLRQQELDQDETRQEGRKTSKSKGREVSILETSIGEEGLNQEFLRYPNWKLPPLSLLIPFKKSNQNEPSIGQNAKVIEQTLSSFGVEAKVVEAYLGPSVVQYALNLPLGTKVEKVVNLSANLALALGVDSKAVRIDSIPETTFLGIEIPRVSRDMVRIKELMSSDAMQQTESILPVPIGKDINGDPIIGDIQKMPHLLIAGATGSGKSVLTNGFINSLIMMKTPDELKLILVDPKQVEFMDYNGIAHLLTPVVTEMERAVNALKWAVGEMEKRYSILAQDQVRNIEGYNQKKGFAAMPYIVIVIDEMADMMMTSNKVEAEVAIVRLAQKARAVGIHLILATQRPSVNVITGIIKANIPGRVAMSVTSSTDSRVILDRMGAESLMGKGDLLYKAPDKTKSLRLQCANIEQQEVIRVVDFIKSQAPEVEYIPEITEKQSTILGDESKAVGGVNENNILEQAIRIVVQSGKGSSSYLQRRLGIGFNRAANLLDELEELGVVGPANGSKPREVLVGDADEFITGLKSV